MKRTVYQFIYLLSCIGLLGCSKGDFLAAKPDQALIVPETLEDLQAIVDNTAVFNGMQGTGGSGIVPVLGQAASDDYFFGRPNLYPNLHLFTKNSFIWDRTDVYGGLENISDWTLPYQGILYANICLEQLSKLSQEEQHSLSGKAIKGSALFHRAHLYYQLAQVFAPVYQKEVAATAPGLPMRLKGDVGEVLKRHTVGETYMQILDDLHGALPYLPETSPYTTRPTRAAAHGLLARVYLAMSDYPASLSHVEKALERQGELLDYNTLDSTARYPIPKDNRETIFSCLISVGGGVVTAFSNSYASVDSSIVQSYAEGDLRKAVFLTRRTQAQSEGMEFRGSYFGALANFGGIATDELYLIKAECLARAARMDDACTALNTLLSKRYDPDMFRPVAVGDQDELLGIVLAERRKELIYRGLRWTDLRRLNLDPRFAVTLQRYIGDEWFELPPNDPRYVFPIPPNVIGFHPDMPQNPR